MCRCARISGSIAVEQYEVQYQESSSTIVATANGHTLVSVGHPASKNEILRRTILRQTAHIGVLFVIGVPFVSKFKGANDSAKYISTF